VSGRKNKYVRLPFVIVLVLVCLWAVSVRVRELHQHTRRQTDYRRLEKDLTDVALLGHAERARLEDLALKGEDRQQKDAAALLMQLRYLYTLAAKGGEEVDYLRLNPAQLRQIQSNMERIKAGQRLYELFTGAFLRAYYSEIDGTFQPYSVCLPPDYDESRSYPLLVQLHQYDGFAPFQSMSARCLAGAICVRPEGRKASDFMFTGEDDVLAVIGEVRELYSVDEGRIYLMGQGMGGTGCWNLAVHYPDLFAGIVSVAGDAGCGALQNGGAEDPDAPGGYGELRRFLHGKHSPASFAVNLAHCRVRAIHGAAGQMTPVQHARAMAGRLRQLGYDFEYLEFPQSAHGDVPFWAKDYALASVFAGPAQKVPRKIRFRTADLRHGGAWWLRVDRLLAPDRFSEVRAQLRDGEVAVETDNVAALTLLVNRMPGGYRPQKVNLDGTQIPVPDGAQGGEFCVESLGGTWQTTRPHQHAIKRRGLSGPFSDIFRDPFMVVYGTAGDSELWMEIARREADRFVWEWQLRYGSPCRLKADSEVDDSDLECFNLLLFGGPQVNRLSARIADRLPIGIGPDAVRVGQRTYQGDDVGVMLCYPNPLSPDRMIALVAGLSPGALYQAYDRTGLWFNHGIYDKYKWFDYAVFDALTWGPETFKVVGFFDNCWRLPTEGSRCELGGGKQWEGLAQYRQRNRRQGFPSMAELPGAEAGKVYLSDVLPVRIRQHRGAVGFDRSYEGGVIRLGERLFGKGLGTKAPSEITYDLQGRYRSFRAVVGLTQGFTARRPPAAVRAGAAVVFEVWGDGKLLSRSPALGWRQGQPNQAELTVDVAGVGELTLKVHAVNTAPHAPRGSTVWADPVLTP